MNSFHTLIVGCGDVGQRLAATLMASGESVQALVRSAASVAALQAAGIAAHAFDLDSPTATPPVALRIYWFAPPPERGTSDPRLRGWIARCVRPPERLVYISTSGVYGDCAGRWIDEDEPLKPQSDRGKRRLDAEHALADWAAAQGVQVMTLRVPGIYGPGRMPVERIRKGLAVIREDQCPYTNRIHAEDLAEVARAAMVRGSGGRAYNVSDGHPTSMTDYFCRCARLLGLPEPPRVTLAEARASFTPALLSFIDESKRLLNRRMVEELGVPLRYPNLESGLPSCMA